MSKHIHNMKIGDSLEVMGPWDKLKYQANMKKKYRFNCRWNWYYTNDTIIRNFFR